MKIQTISGIKEEAKIFFTWNQEQYEWAKSHKILYVPMNLWIIKPSKWIDGQFEWLHSNNFSEIEKIIKRPLGCCNAVTFEEYKLIFDSLPKINSDYKKVIL